MQWIIMQIIRPLHFYRPQNIYTEFFLNEL